jgi:Kef-type K+ transport system membrane component KefB/Trk K+ transport system NAD-binding subunit
MEQLLGVVKELIGHNQLTQMSLLLTVVIMVTGVLKWFKQPLIIGYLLSGVIIWPFVLGFLTPGEENSFIELFSQLGIALLLFMVGLGLNPKVIKEHGKTAVGVWFLQIVGTVLVWFLLAKLLGYDLITSGYIALALTFSSTIVIVKLLSDLEEDDTLYGKLSIGILIVQDLVVMLLLMIISLVNQNSGGSDGMMLLGWVALVGMVIVFARYVLPGLVKWLADVQEYLLLIGIGRCLLLGSLFWGIWFSFEIGCLLAWMSFAMSPYRIEIANKLKSLRDFFLVLFFLHIGMQLSFANFQENFLVIVLSSLFVIVGKPLLVYVSAKFYGFTNQTALKAGMSIGQISEFSFLLIGMGIASGHIQDTTLLSTVMFIGLITIILSSYATIHNNIVHQAWRKLLWDEHVHAEDEEVIAPEEIADVMLFGYGRMGASIAQILEKHGLSYIVVDHNPNLIGPMAIKQIPFVFADAINSEMYKTYMKHGVKMVISTIKDFDDDWEIVTMTKSHNPDINVFVVSNDIDAAVKLYEAGADYVIMPNHISAHHTGMLIEEIGFDVEKLVVKKTEHLEYIKMQIKSGMWKVLKI